VEENVKNGGYGEHVSAYMQACHPDKHVLSIAIWDRFVEHGNVDSLRAKLGLSPAAILQAIQEYEEQI
jgi:1-deoxy-D-xylulose-5-phosphate synthase